MSGIELGHEIRWNHPGLAVLTSGYSHVLAEKGRHNFELLQKPYALEDLSRVLRRAMRARRVLTRLDPCKHGRKVDRMIIATATPIHSAWKRNPSGTSAFTRRLPESSRSPYGQLQSYRGGSLNVCFRAAPRET